MNNPFDPEILTKSHAITTEDYVLTPITADDAELIFAIRSREDTMYFLGLEPYKHIEEAQAFVADSMNTLEEKRGITFVITHQKTGQKAGYFGYWRIFEQHARGEIGYATHPDFRSKGVMRQIFPHVIRFGFTNLGLHSIYAETSDDNHASMKLLTNNGFVQDGCFRESYFYRGEFIDCLYFSKLATDK